MDMPPLRIIVISSDPLARAGLVALLSQADSITIAAQDDASADLLQTTRIYPADALVWDLGWESSGLPDILADLDLPAVLLSGESPPAVPDLPSPFAILPRQAGLPALVLALRAVTGGLVVFSPDRLPPFSAGPPVPDTSLPEPLTPRELEVLTLLAEGLSNKAIARRLQISDHTVKFHVNAIMGKLQAQSRTEAVVTAARLGLLML